jgi:hypothetical protein
LRQWREDHVRRPEETVELWEHVLSRRPSALGDELWVVYEQVRTLKQWVETKPPVCSVVRTSKQWAETKLPAKTVTRTSKQWAKTNYVGCNKLLSKPLAIAFQIYDTNQWCALFLIIRNQIDVFSICAEKDQKICSRTEPPNNFLELRVPKHRSVCPPVTEIYRNYFGLTGTDILGRNRPKLFRLNSVKS